MYNLILKGLIKNFRREPSVAFTSIYAEFKGLIYFYSSRVHGEDTAQELTIFLIELLYFIELDKFKSDHSDTLSRYIAVSIRNKYIALAKEKQKGDFLFLQLAENDVIFEDFLDEKLNIFEALKSLSERQKHIIIYKYIYNYTDVEIAEILNISRQAVNRLKNRALLTLKDYYNFKV